MEKEIIIPRKKSTSIKASLLMLFAVILFFLPIILYFIDVKWIEAKFPVFVVIICGLLLPVLIYCFIFYVQNIFNNNPILQVNEIGIHEQMSMKSVGIIKWEDISYITIIPYMDNTHFICIHLSNPKQYITSERKLRRIMKKKKIKKWGEVNFSSLYFKKDISKVLDLIKYFYQQYHDEPLE